MGKSKKKSIETEITTITPAQNERALRESNNKEIEAMMIVKPSKANNDGIERLIDEKIDKVVDKKLRALSPAEKLETEYKLSLLRLARYQSHYRYLINQIKLMMILLMGIGGLVGYVLGENAYIGIEAERNNLALLVLAIITITILVRLHGVFNDLKSHTDFPDEA